MKYRLEWIAIAVLAAMAASCGGAARLTELQRVKSGTLDVVLLSSHEALRHGKDTFVIEFRSMPAGTLVDVGTVKAGATMPMPGMPMMGSIDVRKADVAGRYEAASDLSMGGTWRTTVEWNGPAGQGSVTLSVSAQ